MAEVDSTTDSARGNPAADGTTVVRCARWLVAAAAVAYLVALAFVVASRIAYPFELEWMEGGVLQHVERVVAGEPLYVPPSLDFTPFIYTPLYYVAAAPLVAALGPGFLPLRLVSLLAASVLLALIYLLVRHETGDRFAGLVAVGLFAATFRRGGAWLDVARVDSLFLVLLVASVYLVRRHRGAAGAAAAGVLLGLSFLTKQVAVSVAAPVVLWLAVTRFRRAVVLGLAAAAVVLPTMAVLQTTSGGWFGYYVLELPPRHAWVTTQIVDFWTRDLLGAVPIATLLAVALLARRDRSLADRGFWLAALVGTVGGSYLARLHSGGWDNVLLPAYAGVALAAGCALPALLARARERGATGHGLAVAVLLALVAQFALLAYDPRAQIPTAADRAAGQATVERLRTARGDVWVPFHGYLSAMAGKPAYAHAQAVTDVWKGGPDDRGRRTLFPALEKELRAHRFAAVVIDQDWFMPDGFADAYAPADAVYADPEVFRPVTGMPWRPERIWLPKPLTGDSR